MVKFRHKNFSGGNIAMKKVIGVLLVMVLALVTAGAALAADEAAPAEEVKTEAAQASGEFDFLKFAKERVLTDFHPTVKVEEAEANYVEEPFYKGDGVTRAKIGIFYSGWIQKHSMEVEIDYRAEDRKVKVNVLKDTNGMNLRGARFFKDGEWVSLASVGWK